MILFISFLLVIVGCINWLLVGLLQYDFVAGLFGYQGSIFSRLIYIIIGSASLFVVFKALAGKGKLNLINFKFSFKKKKKEKEDLQPAYSNIEAGKDFDEKHKKGFFKRKESNNQDFETKSDRFPEDEKNFHMSGKDYSEQDFSQPPDERERTPKNNIFDEI